MIKYVPIIIIFSYNIFFVISAILGYQYLGSEESSIYILYNMLLFITAIILFLYESIIKRVDFQMNQLLAMSIPFIVFAVFLLELFFGKINVLGTRYLIYFFLWGVPSILMGIYLSRFNRIRYLGKFMEIVMLFFSVAVIISLISVVITNTRASIGGATYQNVAYIAAFAFGVNLYYIFFGENHERFAFARSKPYYYLCYVLLLFQLSSVIASGGRGGMILVIVYSVYLFLLLLKDKSSSKKLKNISLIILIGIIGMITQLKLLSISIYESSLNRAFSYLSGGDTSGRDTLYNDAMHVILDSPLFGYGLFGMFDYYNDYPHNFFLEVLMQGGLFYLVFWFVIIMYLIIKYINISMKFKAFRLISVIALYPIVVLMVSGTYINQSVFWFIISFIISYKIKLSD